MSNPCSTRPTNPCPSYPNAQCIVYTGGNLTCAGIRTNDRLDAILAKIDAKLCTSGGGTTFIEEGENIIISGAGTSASPYVINSTSAYTDEQAQDAVGGILSNEFSYNDGAPSISINEIDWSKIINIPPTANIYTVDGTLEENRAVNLDNKRITWDNNNEFIIRDDGPFTEQYTFSHGIEFESTDSVDTFLITQSLAEGIYLGWNNAAETSTTNIGIDSTGMFLRGLTNLSSQTRLIGQDGATNKIGYITISGNDITLSNGILGFTSGNFIKNQSAIQQPASTFWISGLAKSAGVEVTGSSIPTNGLYLPSSNEIGLSTNSVVRARILSSGGMIVGPLAGSGNGSILQVKGILTTISPSSTDSHTFISATTGALNIASSHSNSTSIFLNSNGSATTGSTALIFSYDAGQIGGIAFTGSASPGSPAAVKNAITITNINPTAGARYFKLISTNTVNEFEALVVDYLTYNDPATTLAGNLRLSKYGTGVVVGTLTYGLGVDASGNVIETTLNDGTVTSFSAGDLSPLFTTTETNPTTTPALSFSLNTQTANTIFAGPTAGSAAAPTFRALVAADLPTNSGSYIQNQIASLQTANFHISGYSAIGTNPSDPDIQLVVSNIPTNSTSFKYGIHGSVGGTFNTTSGSLTSYGIVGSAISTRTSGANSLRNIAIYGNASSGQLNYSAYFDQGDIFMGSLANTTTQNRLVGQDSSTNIIDYVTIGSGLSLSAGVLSATSAGSQNLQSVLTVGSTLTGANVIDAGGFDFEVSNIDDLTLENSGTLFLKIANHGSATVGDVLAIQNTTTGECIWQANGVGAGGSVTNFTAGDLSPLFTTNVATATSTPDLTFALTDAGANTYLGNATGSIGAPSYTTAGSLTRTNDTNVTLTLGGNPTTSLLRDTSLTLGWTGTLAITRGGTGLGALGTALQLPRVNAGATALEYFTPTYISANQTITLSGDVTGSGTTAITTTIANDAVTNAKMANMASARIKGRVTASTGDPEDLTGTQATTLLDVFTSSLKGVAPASGGGTTNFLRADGVWTTPAGGGTVTSVNITQPAAGITASGGPITTSGAITLALADDLAAVEALATTGIVRRTGAATWTAGGVVTVAEGGTGLTSTPTNGQFLIGNGTGYTLASITGTTNQITVTGGAGSSTLSLPQNIHTAATPQFARMGIGTASSSNYGVNIGGSGYAIAALGVVASTSAQASSDAYVALVAGTIVEAGSGIHSMLSALALSPAIITPGSATVTRTATCYVSGASSATVTDRNYAIYSASGANYLGGDIYANANNVNSTNNYDVVVRNQSTGRVETIPSDVIAINSQTGTTYTLVLTDKGAIVDRDNASANTTTIPLNSSVAFPIGTQIVIRQKGAGQTTITPTGGVTLQGADGAFITRVQHSAATIVKMASDTWWASGDLTT